MRKLAEVLTADNWIKGTYTRDDHGNDVDCLTQQSSATRYCVVGAACVAAGISKGQELVDLENKLTAIVIKVTGKSRTEGACITNFNDAKTTTFVDLLPIIEEYDRDNLR